MSSSTIKSLIVFTFAGIFVVSANSQNSVTDSLKNLLEKEPPDSVKVYLLYKISDQYFNSTMHDTAMLFARQAYKLALETEYKKGEARSLTRIGNILEATGDFPEALKKHLDCLEISEKMNDLIGIGAAYNNIARVYTEQKTRDNFDKAIVYYMKAKAIFEKLKDNRNLGIALLNIGDNYEKMDELDSAWLYQKEAYDMSVQNEDINYMGITLVNLGYIQYKKGQTDSAFKNLRAGIQYLIESDDRESLPDAWNSLSDCFKRTGRSDSAIYYAKKSYNLAEEASNLESLLDAVKQLSALYESEQKFDSAFAYSKLATRFDSNLYDREKTAKIQTLNFREQIRQQELEEQIVVDAKKRKDSLQIISISVFIITFFVVLILLSQKKINPRAIEILGVLGLLLIFEFITIFIHPFIGDLTHHTPVYMLVILVLIASVLGPLHHYLTKWLKKKLVRQTEAANKISKTAIISGEPEATASETQSLSSAHHTGNEQAKPANPDERKVEILKQPVGPTNDGKAIDKSHVPIINTDPPSEEKKK